MSDDGTGILNENLHPSDDDSNAASLGSTRLSDDSGIEDWSDDMTIQTETQDSRLRQDLDDKHHSPEIIFNHSISPIKEDMTLTECIFPALPDINPLHDFKQDIISEDATAGVCGLYNLGNTCFMNAALQCLFASDALKDLLCQGDILQKGSDHSEERSNILLFVERFQEMFQKVLSGKYSVLRPDQFHQAVAKLHPTLGDYKQHDSQEFLSFLLNTLHELLNRGRPKLKCSPSHAMDIGQHGSTSDDFSDNIIGDVSKRLKMDSDVEESSQMEPDAGVVCEENLSKAGAAWRSYTSINQSMIVDSFQGQFQSVIICEKCSFISTTYEPFMSLSLPIPHAMEKQFIITWLPSPKFCPLPGMISATKYCVTVTKKSNVSDIKEAFLSMMRKKDDQLKASQVVLVEVNKSASVSILDDRTQISYLNNKKDIYAMEVIQGTSSNPLLGDTDECGKIGLGLNGFQETNGFIPEENILDNSAEENTVLGDMSLDDNTYYNNNGVGNLDISLTDANISQDNLGEPFGQVTAMAESIQGAAAWHSCGICLEEIFDEELKVHIVCGGMLCDSCLTNLVEVNNTIRFPCPICNRYISTEDYTPLVEPKENGKVSKEVIRQVLVPVMFRHGITKIENSTRKFNLFGHPVICSLPSSVDSTTILEHVNQILQNYPFVSVSYDVVITDGTGLSCGSCDLFSSCTGCLISKQEVWKLKPGSCCSVHFHDNLEVVMKTLNLCHEDTSMREFRNSDQVSLDECLAKFGDTEILTKENPWFCTQCKLNQSAVKNMAVTRWPETLIIHLKRFYFEGNQCCKIECPVNFPLKDLDMDVLTCADSNSDGTKDLISYNLLSFICHTGTLFGGHYTAVAKPNSNSDWFYFNDETFEKMEPSDEDKQKAYVLFYQRDVSN